MGPKIKFTKEQIVEAAFEIAQTEGIDSITMRKIAEKMGSSVAPIYVNFKNVQPEGDSLGIMGMCCFTYGRGFVDKSFNNIMLHQHCNR